MYNIVVIGAGQLGRRHIQSIKSTHYPCRLFVVDNVRESLEKTKAVYDSTQVRSQISEIYYVENYDRLPHVIDFLLISTGAKPRAIIFKTISEHFEIKNVIFEKVLFQRESEYQEVADIITLKGIKAWVNCPRRMFEGYKKLRTLFNGKTVNMVVNGGLWGIGCNSIHFLDIYAYLTKCDHYTIITDALDEGIMNSKRSGYKEFSGTLVARFENGGTVILSSSRNTICPVITLCSDDTTCFISETAKECWLKSEKNDKVFSFSIPYQSELTYIVLDDILKKGDCDLTTYSESKKIHLPFIRGMIDFLNTHGYNTDNCPIT